MLRNTPSKLCICLLNVSEARNIDIVKRIAHAAVCVSDCPELDLGQAQNQRHSGKQCESAVLNIFSDYDYNRSVITIASSADKLVSSVVRACKEAYRSIDLSIHSGGHPRLGAVDLIPIHPIAADVSLEQCGQVAKDITQQLAEEVKGTSFFLFGHADQNGQRGLVQRRKEVKWFSGSFDSNSYDVGQAPGSRYGLTGAGAIPYVMNCNVTIETQDIEIGRTIAKAIRATSVNGLPGVQSMAFHHEGNIEIACNVESVVLPNHSDCYKATIDRCDAQDISLLPSFGDFYHVSPKTIFEKVKKLASDHNVKTRQETIVGFTPDEANRLTCEALATQQYEFWKTRPSRKM